MDDWYKTAKDLAESHVDWFLEMIRPLLIEHMIHGFKHGTENATVSTVYFEKDKNDGEKNARKNKGNS